MPNPYLAATDPTTAWAQDAVDGKFVVGDIVRAQAERHLRDIREGEQRGLFWRPDAATHGFVGFLVMLLCRAMELDPLWSGFVVGIFGWLGANVSIRLLERLVYDKLGIRILPERGKTQPSPSDATDQGEQP